MKKTQLINYVFVLLLSAGLFQSCKKDKVPVNEEELITTIQLAFTEQPGGAITTFTFRDIDGEGGNPPTLFEDIVLDAGKTYAMKMTLLNESVSPSENITDEIIDEAADHQFYFQPSAVSVAVGNLDSDANGLPLGVNSTWVAGTVSNGTVRITLKHKPGIKAAGDAVTKGDTDIEIDWPARVQ